MIVRTCPYDKRDGTRCNSPAVKGYDGCYFHSRLLRAQRHRTRVLNLLMQVRGKLPQRRLVWVAKELGCLPPPGSGAPQLLIGDSPQFASEVPLRVRSRKTVREWYDSSVKVAK
jgi:hypothetical protein